MYPYTGNRKRCCSNFDMGDSAHSTSMSERMRLGESAVNTNICIKCWKYNTSSKKLGRCFLNLVSHVLEPQNARLVVVVSLLITTFSK